MLVEILNTKAGCLDGWYGGRGSPIGNPVSLKESTRDEACDAYEKIFKDWLAEGKPDVLLYLNGMLEELERTGYVAIRCHCAPSRCHLETVRRWLLDNAFADDSSFY